MAALSLAEKALADGQKTEAVAAIEARAAEFAARHGILFRAVEIGTRWKISTRTEEHPSDAICGGDLFSR